MDENNTPEEYIESSSDPKDLLERLTRRYLGDVRIHDSHQAGELARRLGARAFTVGRDIYVRPELVKPMSPQGAALLAHELYHVAEQSGAASGPQDMPLLAPPSHMQQPPRPGTARRPSVEGRAGGRGVSPLTGGMAVQRAQGAVPSSGSSSEDLAESVGQSALNAQMAHRRPRVRKPPPPDPEELAERVYDMIMRDMIIDRERGRW